MLKITTISLVVKKISLSLYGTKRETMKATLNFQTNEQAILFASAWSRATTSGHILGDTEVTVYNVNDEGKAFIEGYIARLNN